MLIGRKGNTDYSVKVSGRVDFDICLILTSEYILDEDHRFKIYTLTKG